MDWTNLVYEFFLVFGNKKKFVASFSNVCISHNVLPLVDSKQEDAVFINAGPNQTWALIKMKDRQNDNNWYLCKAIGNDIYPWSQSYSLEEEHRLYNILLESKDKKYIVKYF